MTSTKKVSTIPRLKKVSARTMFWGISNKVSYKAQLRDAHEDVKCAELEFDMWITTTAYARHKTAMLRRALRERRKHLTALKEKGGRKDVRPS